MVVLFQLLLRDVSSAGRNEIFSCLTKLKGSKYSEGGKAKRYRTLEVEPSFLNSWDKVRLYTQDELYLGLGEHIEID